MIETTLALLAAKVKAASTAAAAHAHMHGLMLDADNPPLCTNVLHNELDCSHSSLPRAKWCAPCQRAYPEGK